MCEIERFDISYSYGLDVIATSAPNILRAAIQKAESFLERGSFDSRPAWCFRAGQAAFVDGVVWVSTTTYNILLHTRFSIGHERQARHSRRRVSTLFTASFEAARKKLASYSLMQAVTLAKRVRLFQQNRPKAVGRGGYRKSQLLKRVVRQRGPA